MEFRSPIVILRHCRLPGLYDLDCECSSHDVENGLGARTAVFAGSPVIWMNVSRDGAKTVFLRSGIQSDVYLCELDKKGLPVSPPRRWTLDEKMDSPETWAADSKSLYFTSERHGVFQIFRRRLDTDVAETVVSGPDGKGYTRVSPNGKWLVYSSAPDGRIPSQSATRIMRMPIAGRRSEEVLSLSGRLKSNDCSWYGMACVSSQKSGVRTWSYRHTIRKTVGAK